MSAALGVRTHRWVPLPKDAARWGAADAKEVLRSPPEGRGESVGAPSLTFSLNSVSRHTDTPAHGCLGGRGTKKRGQRWGAGKLLARGQSSARHSPGCLPYSTCHPEEQKRESQSPGLQHLRGVLLLPCLLLRRLGRAWNPRRPGATASAALGCSGPRLLPGLGPRRRGGDARQLRQGRSLPARG